MFKIDLNNGIPEVSAENFKDFVGKVRLVDVRRPEEFTGELGHIPGAELVTLGPELQAFLDTAKKEDVVVFVCRSGARSGQATMFSRQIGFTNTFNLTGGMLRWNDLKFSIEK